MRKQNKAFTLVELLVAMAIIGVLLGLAIFGLSTAQRAQRDTERKTALQDLNMGVQVFYETYNRYPSVATIAETQITLSNPVCSSGANGCRTVVPLKGSASALTTCNIGTYNATTDSNRTCYIFDPQVGQGNASIPGGYALCAKMENGSYFCVGSGANSGNIVQNGASTGFTIP